MSERCWLRLHNGWTVSISAQDTPPAICSVAAWPTRQDDLVMLGTQTYYDVEWFNFGRDGVTDQRCFVYTDIRDSLKKISEAPPPASVQ